jgi:2-polyprenyl-3-methyl-5-hydroxy-6-metoxy-1,4-benzoquinol methylase
VCEAAAAGEPALGTLARCRACGFVTWPGARSQDVETLYDEDYFTRVDYPDYVGNESSLRRSMRRHLDQMSRYGGLEGNLLEIGCAYGFFLDEARRHFSRVMGIDVAASAVSHARQALGLDARAGRFLDMDFDEESFDAVCLWDTIEHVPRPERFLDRARTLLHPGGWLYLTTGDLSSLNARLRGARWRQIHPPSHLHYFSRATIQRLLERLGFEVVGFETAAYYHTVHNVLASIALREGTTARVARVLLRAMGEPVARRLGLWVDLGDIMFVVARRTLAPPPSQDAARS